MGNQDPSDEDLTMQIYKIFEEELVNQETAVEFARLLLRARFGADELARQEPLIINDAETRGCSVKLRSQ